MASMENGSPYRARRYYESKNGRVFTATHQTPGTDVTGQTSFAATTPTFLLQTSSASKRITDARITLTQVGTVAGGQIDVVVAIDSAARFASGGTAVTPSNSLAGSSTTSQGSFYFNPTASAAGTGTKYVFATAAAAGAGASLSIDFEDGIQIPETGSILVYTWAPTTGPSWAFSFEWTEE